MRPKIAVLGRKNSGKTTMTRTLIRELRSKGLKVMSAKHVHCKDFTIDKENTDTWYHAKEGADPVVCVSDDETAILHKGGTMGLDTKALITIGGTEVDVLVMEGFSDRVLMDQDVAKVIMIKDTKDHVHYKEVTGPMVLFVDAPASNNVEELDLTDIDDIPGKVLEFISEEKEALLIARKFRWLDCRKCHYPTCTSLARAIRKGKAKEEDCIPFKARPSMGSGVTVHGEELGLQRFTSEFIRNTVLGMLKAMKNVDIKGNEVVEITVKGPDEDR